jgi:hypothetical protein
VQMLFALPQGALRSLAVDRIVQLGDKDHGETCQREKQQEIREISSVFNVERQMWPYYEEVGRKSAERDANKASADAADQRRDDNCWPERNERDRNNIWIDREPQHSRKPNGRESKEIASKGSRPQRRNIDVKLR